MQLLRSFLSHLRRPPILSADVAYLKQRLLRSSLRHCSVLTKEDIGIDHAEEEEYQEVSDTYLGPSTTHNVCVLQPYIKWGKEKRRNTTPELQLSEAVALVNSLSGWRILEKRLIPLLTLERKTLLGSGALESLKETIRSLPELSAVFVSTNKLRFCQLAELQKELQLPVYDRYSLVIHLFRQHAVTVEAKLQVSLAEIPYVRRKMLELVEVGQCRINLTERTRLMLDRREKKLKLAMKKLELHRTNIRTQRKKFEFPTIAVVGYTNAGKTSLIKALTGREELNPVNKLFATLDTTVHEGTLPSSMKVLFVDTIGFIQDVPETLIEPFKVTLRDAIDSDILVHVYDASHPDMKAQVDHVRDTLAHMTKDKTILEVANKCDEPKASPLQETLKVSALKGTGLNALLETVEDELIKATGLTYTKIKVKNGSEEASWLHKHGTVVNVDVDPANTEFLIMEVLSSPGVIAKFKHMMRK